jgi:hypothetical protein
MRVSIQDAAPLQLPQDKYAKINTLETVMSQHCEYFQLSICQISDPQRVLDVNNIGLEKLISRYSEIVLENNRSNRPAFDVEKTMRDVTF